MVRFATLTFLLFLLFASPSLADVSSVTVDNATPSAAAGARTVYRVGLTVSAPLTNTGSVRIALPGDSGLGVWSGGTLRDVTRGVDVGSCPAPNTQVTVCTFFSSGFVNAGDRLVATLRGIVNPPTPGNRTAAASTSAEPAVVNSALFATLAAGQVTTPTVTIASPSAAAGALTRYVIGFNVSADGGLSGEAGSAITVNLPSGTGVSGWQSGTVRNVTTSTDVGSCPQPSSGPTTTCTFFSSGVVNGGDRLEINLRGLTNGTAGAKTLSVSTTTDLPAVTSNAFTVVPAGALTTPTVAIADPSPATGAITRYVTDFRVSGTGGLSGEAGSSITVTLPAGTGTTSWQSGTVRNVSTAADVGSCPQPTSGVTRCTFFSSGIVNPNDQLRITLRGLTNGPAGAKTLSVVTSTDLTPVTSSQLHGRRGRQRHHAHGEHRHTLPGDRRADPLRRRLQRLRHRRAVRRGRQRDHRRSSRRHRHDRLAERDAARRHACRRHRQLPAAHRRPHALHVLLLRLREPRRRAADHLRGLTNAGVGARTVAVTTSSDLPQIQSSRVHRHRGGHARGPQRAGRDADRAGHHALRGGDARVGDGRAVG